MQEYSMNKKTCFSITGAGKTGWLYAKEKRLEPLLIPYTKTNSNSK